MSELRLFFERRTADPSGKGPNHFEIDCGAECVQTETVLPNHTPDSARAQAKETK